MTYLVRETEHVSEKTISRVLLPAVILSVSVVFPCSTWTHIIYTGGALVIKHSLILDRRLLYGAQILASRYIHIFTSKKKVWLRVWWVLPRRKKKFWTRDATTEITILSFFLTLFWRAANYYCIKRADSCIILQPCARTSVGYRLEFPIFLYEPHVRQRVVI